MTSSMEHYPDRDHIPNSFDSLVSWLGIVDWAELHEIARQLGGGYAEYMSNKPRHMPSAQPLTALKREYERAINES